MWLVREERAPAWGLSSDSCALTGMWFSQRAGSPAAAVRIGGHQPMSAAASGAA